jgi:hypothetical protein
MQGPAGAVQVRTQARAHHHHVRLNVNVANVQRFVCVFWDVFQSSSLLMVGGWLPDVCHGI